MSEGWPRPHRLIGTDRRTDLKDDALLQRCYGSEVCGTRVELGDHAVYLVQAHNRIDGEVVRHKLTDALEVLSLVLLFLLGFVNGKVAVRRRGVAETGGCFGVQLLDVRHV